MRITKKQILDLSPCVDRLNNYLNHYGNIKGFSVGEPLSNSSGFEMVRKHENDFIEI